MEVLIMLGSKSDMDTGEEIIKTLKSFDVGHELHIASAHRTPEKVKALVKRAENEGASAIIAGAGMSAHLAGVVAAETLLPVIGIPLVSGPLNGVDALYSTVNMPPGIPVATVSVGKAGGKNAALLALRIMAVTNSNYKTKLEKYREDMAEAVEKADKEING